MSDQTILAVTKLEKTFKVGFQRKVVNAVQGLDFSVDAGEIYGFLGPNGAGKTTTIKMIMDLIRPSAGSVKVFGDSPGALASRKRIGYLPEHPYFYDYLKPTELLEFFGRLHGIKKTARRKQIHELLEQVGLTHAKDRTLRRYSKGMLQRFGLAQALIGDPDLVILDEPLSGLDPIGRKEMKDIVSGLKAKGKTVFFSSHILSDIELLCDKIAMIDEGRLLYAGPTRDFVVRGQLEVEIIASNVPEGILTALKAKADSIDSFGSRQKVLCNRDSAQELLKLLIESSAIVESVVPRSETLEEVFVRTAQHKQAEVSK